MKIQPAPKYLPEVLKVISDLNETGGSSARKIVGYLLENESHSLGNGDLRNLTVQVRRALNHARENGIILQRAGKFRINKQILEPLRDCDACRRRKRREKEKKMRGKGRRKRRRKGMKQSRGLVFDTEDSDEDDLPVRQLKTRSKRRTKGEKHSRGLMMDTEDRDQHDFPVRQLKRRSKGRRKGSKGKKKRRRRRKKEHMDSVQEPPSSPRNKSTTAIIEDVRKDVPYPDDLQQGEGPINPSHHDVQCDNPDCLCNVQGNVEEVENLELAK